MPTIAEKIEQRMAELAKGTEFRFPPPAARLLDVQFIDYQEGRSLMAEYPLRAEYHNPAGHLMGGFYGAFFDLTMGPLSFLAAGKYAVSLDLNISFHQALQPTDTAVVVTAVLQERSRRLLFLTGEAKSSSGVVIATATSRMMIVQS